MNYEFKLVENKNISVVYFNVYMVQVFLFFIYIINEMNLKYFAIYFPQIKQLKDTYSQLTTIT